jgi:hypothetical protein
VTVRGDALTTDADLLEAADAGELWRVEIEDGEAQLLSEADARTITQDDTYAQDWIVVRASCADEARAIARAYDESPEWRVSHLRAADQVLALVRAAEVQS